MRHLPPVEDVRGHQLLTQSEHLLPATRDRTRGIFLTHQAAGHLTHHGIEPAAHALELTRRTHARMAGYR
ncbi:hypothetical protein [Streptomyces sp. SID5789]|uniref:hypothetical protein n=1 Tax=Streptomyces sp. SID5789 TaxID=2690310 RepID=UPI0013699EF5|nr:hypothetical protein [Streptomyces sp. SID5789]MZE69649.1 hypothetical protein [Streptomyces sp. SID5789]